jgi:Protein of unknown function (DUF5818)
MKRARKSLFWAALIGSVSLLVPSTRAAGEKIFAGEIADTQCALNVHSLHQSHQEMIEMGEAGSSPAECTRYCVKNRGGRYALQTKQEVYKLDNQELPEKFAGKKVKITGILDPKTNTIQVRSIERIPSK